MAYSEYATQLSLDRFFALSGIHPFHANQLRTPSIAGETRAIGCSSVIYQHRYQSDSGIPGRSDIAREIFQAERDIEQFVRFPLLKRWIAGERVPVMREPDVRLPFTYGFGHRAARNQSVEGFPLKLFYGYFVQPGIRATTLIDEGLSIGTEDEDEDGFEETALIQTTLSPSEYSALGSSEELRLFYPGKGPDPTWEIRPITVTIDPSTRDVEIRCSISQLVDPKFSERMIPGPLSPDDDIFLSAVDLYRVYTDTSFVHAYAFYCDETLLTASVSGLAFGVLDAEGGIIELRAPLSGLSSFLCACPTPTARISYAAGFPASTFTQMAAPLENAVAILAMSRLGGICACTNVPNYSRDLNIISHTETHGVGNMTQTRWALHPPDRVMKNPFGTSEGARMAYDIIVTEILGETGNSYL